MIMVSYSKQYRLNQQMEKIHREGPGETKDQLPAVLVQWSPADSFPCHSNDKTAPPKWYQPGKPTEPRG